MKNLTLLLFLFLFTGITNAQNGNALPGVASVHAYRIGPNLAEVEIKITGIGAAQAAQSGTVNITGDIIPGGSFSTIVQGNREVPIGGGQTATVIARFPIKDFTPGGQPYMILVKFFSDDRTVIRKMRLGQLDGAAITSVG